LNSVSNYLELSVLFFEGFVCLISLDLSYSELDLKRINNLEYFSIGVHGTHPQADRLGSKGEASDVFGVEALIVNKFLQFFKSPFLDIILREVLQTSHEIGRIIHQPLGSWPVLLHSLQEADSVENHFQLIFRLLVHFNFRNIASLKRVKGCQSFVVLWHSFIQNCLTLTLDLSDVTLNPAAFFSINSGDFLLLTGRRCLFFEILHHEFYANFLGVNLWP